MRMAGGMAGEIYNESMGKIGSTGEIEEEDSSYKHIQFLLFFLGFFWFFYRSSSALYRRSST